MIRSTSDVAAAKPQMTAEARQIILKEFGAKWGKLSKHDLSALKDNDDLVKPIVTKYGLEKVQAQRDVDALLEGRDI